MPGDAFSRLSIIRRDPGRVGRSLQLLPDQIREAWAETPSFRWPAGWSVQSVVVSGMGGSHLGADIVRSVFSSTLSRPIDVVADDVLPGWVGRDTLVICVSYSGETEETIAAFQAAIKRRARVVVVTTGGRLAAAAAARRLPLIRFRPSANPSGQPRLGVAYGLMAVLAILRQAKVLRLGAAEVEAMAAAAAMAVRRYRPSVKTQRNLAKQLANDLRGRTALLIGGTWASGNLHTFANQLHETAKTFAAWHVLPELNHHLMEGLRHRTEAGRMLAIMVRDHVDFPQLRRRFALTAVILRRLGLTVRVVTPVGPTVLTKAVDLLALGGYVSWYLAARRRVNPAAIPTIDALKRALGRRP